MTNEKNKRKQTKHRTHSKNTSEHAKTGVTTTFCPINFGDCPDCEFWKENECTHLTTTLPWADAYRTILHTPKLSNQQKLNAFAQHCNKKEQELNHRWNHERK